MLRAGGLRQLLEMIGFGFMISDGYLLGVGLFILVEDVLW